ncbi:MAG TPA: hypothetical protein VLH35_03195 [Candidatus Acidoferrales bacterium]|nr:hypothetical protein [Candidatus Acidoferrales bacterium]
MKDPSLAAARREVLADFAPAERKLLAIDVVVDSALIPPDAKVSCKFGDCCTSPSRRDQTKTNAWRCGSSFSHDVRMCTCITYVRFERFLQNSQSGNRRFPK